MPLSLPCPNCSSRVTAPDRLAGKTVKCPKCQSPFTLPAPDPGFEVVEDDEPVVAKPRVKPPEPASGFSVVEDEEPIRPRVKKVRKRVVEEDEEPELPRRRSSSGSATSHTRLFVALGGGVVFLGIVAVGLFFAMGKVGTKSSSPEPAPNPAPVPAPAPAPVAPAEWKTFAPPNAGFSVSLPGTPATPEGLGDGALLGGLQGWELSGTDLEYKIIVFTLPPDAAGVEGAGAQKLDEQVKLFTDQAGADGVRPTDAKLGKHPARQYVYSQGTEHTAMRAGVVGGRVYFFIVTSKSKPIDAATDGVAKYFDSITVQ